MSVLPRVFPHGIADISQAFENGQSVLPRVFPHGIADISQAFENGQKEFASL
jgi:hypothetical protein